MRKAFQTTTSPPETTYIKPESHLCNSSSFAPSSPRNSPETQENSDNSMFLTKSLPGNVCGHRSLGQPPQARESAGSRGAHEGRRKGVLSGKNDQRFRSILYYTVFISVWGKGPFAVLSRPYSVHCEGISMRCADAVVYVLWGPHTGL